ncbi:Carboxylic ester hydrolase [Aphelenchoides bicaudatus]|nr:Carboxylic ester hydrolase [Aphelenchoides bicaudatus]
MLHNFWLFLLLLSAEWTLTAKADDGSGSDDEGPLVDTLNGPIRGFNFKLPEIQRHKTDIDTAHIFLGIPYAKPPIKELRLEKPKPVENWTETLDTTEFPLGCVPHHPLGAFNYDEDCLYLNVFTPNRKSPEKNGWPVVIFIHGGGFCTGSASQFGYEVVSDNFVSQGIITITIQYRLGMLGFFSNGDSKLPGNLGLWDQREALIWIKNNIDRFGGDPNRITLWGQSAGAASTSMHSISKQSRGLFQQMIIHSGSPYTKWSTNEKVVEMSQSLAKTLNCPIDNSEALKSCMKDLDLEDIMEGASEFGLARDDFAFLTYNPRFDNDFFDADHEVSMAESPQMPTLLGFNKHEGIFLTIEIPNSVLAFRSALTVDTENIPDYTKTTLESFIKGSGAQIIGSQLPKDEFNKLINKTVDFYVDKWNNSADYKHYLKQYTYLVTDLGFVVPLMREAHDRANKGATVYVFTFDHVNAELKSKLPFRAVSHGAEYPYLFGAHIFGYFDLNKQDHKAKRVLVNAFANFIKNGDPSTKKLKWTPLKTDQTPKVTVLKTFPYVDPHLKSLDRVKFWNDITKDFDYDIVRGVKKPKLPSFEDTNQLKRSARAQD